MANYGDISYGLTIEPWQVIQRKSDDTWFEAINKNEDISSEWTVWYWSWFWQTDNTSVLDMSPNTNNDWTPTWYTFNNGTVSWWVTIENEVIKLDWANGYISYQSSPAEQRTVEVWVKVNDLSSYRQISVGNAWTWWRNEFAIWTNWEIRFIFPDETWDVRNFVSWNWVITAWQEYHIIFSRLSTWTYLRVNWVDVNITSISASDNVYTWTYFLWAKADLSQYNPIEIKWFRTYTRQLTTQEAIDCYNAWPNSYTPIWDWLAIQLSGKYFAWTEATPTTIYDMNHIWSIGKWDISCLFFDWTDDVITATVWEEKENYFIWYQETWWDLINIIKDDWVTYVNNVAWTPALVPFYIDWDTVYLWKEDTSTFFWWKAMIIFSSQTFGETFRTNMFNRTKDFFTDNNPQWSNIWFWVKGWLTVDKIKALNLPTSDTWLEVWELWNDTWTIKIKL